MTNKKLMVSALALAIGAGGAALAGGATGGVQSGGFSAGVALLSPEQTGFRYQAQLGVEGVGSGAVTVSTNEARHQFGGFAFSGADVDPMAGPIVDAGAGVLGTFDFDRSVETNGSLAGQGNVLAFGDATGASGFSGAAFGESSIAGTFGGDAFNRSAEAESEGALSGSVRTRNTLNLRGTESGFVGSLGTTVGGQDTAISFSSLFNFGSAIDIDPIDLADAAEARDLFNLGAGNGVAFDVASTLAGGQIDLGISSGGGGIQQIEVETGGFFTGGAAAFGDSGFNTAGTGFGILD